MSGVYPGYLMPQMPQTLMPQMSHQALFMQQSLCMQQMQQQPLLQQMQQSVFPPTAQNYPAYLANPPTGPGGEVDEVGLREPNRDTSLSPSAGMVASGGEQEEKEDYMAELAREKEVLVSRGMTREGSLLMRLLERGELLTRNKKRTFSESNFSSILNSQRSACVSPAMLAPPWTRTGGCWTSTGRSPSG